MIPRNQSECSHNIYYNTLKNLACVIDDDLINKTFSIGCELIGIELWNS